LSISATSTFDDSVFADFFVSRPTIEKFHLTRSASLHFHSRKKISPSLLFPLKKET